MHRTLDHLDNALIDRIFQPAVDWIGAYLSLDCFAQARVCTGISAIAWILSQAGELILASRSAVVGLQVFQATLLLLGLSAIMVLHTLFQRAGSAGTGHGRANPLRLTMYGHRMVIMAGLVVSLVKAFAGVGSFALLAMVLFAMAAVYAGACSNAPPRQHVRLGRGWGRRWRPLAGSVVPDVASP